MDPGKVRIVYRHFAFIGPESEWAAQAAECANDQDQFWAYTNYLFTHQIGENNGTFSKNNLKQFAATLGLDTAKFNACFDASKYAELVRQQSGEARARGVQSTPTFFINGKLLDTVPSKEQLAAYFDSLLKK